MSVTELLRLALSRLRTSRLRAALTMLGVIIGVASVVALVGVGQGTTSNITTALASLGTNLLDGQPDRAVGRRLDELVDRRRRRDRRARRRGRRRAGGLDEPERVRPATRRPTTTIVGTTEGIHDGPRLRRSGRAPFLTDVSVDRGLRVAVLGKSTADDLGLGRR